MIAIYTSAGKIQTQSIAYSLDNGRTFTTYEEIRVERLNYPDSVTRKYFGTTLRTNG
jgi:fructan beta-fructosidase